MIVALIRIDLERKRKCPAMIWSAKGLKRKTENWEGIFLGRDTTELYYRFLMYNNRKDIT